MPLQGLSRLPSFTASATPSVHISPQAAAGHIKALAAAQAETKLLSTHHAFQGAWAPKVKTRPTTPRGRMFESVGSSPTRDVSALSQPQHRTPPRPTSTQLGRTLRGVGMDECEREEDRDGIASPLQPRPPEGTREVAPSPRTPEAVPASFDLGPPPGPTAPSAFVPPTAKRRLSDQAATAAPSAAAAAAAAARYDGAPVRVLSKGLDLVILKEGSAMAIPSPIGLAPKLGTPRAPDSADRPSSTGGEGLSPWDDESSGIAPRVTTTALHSRGDRTRNRPGSARERAASPERVGMDVAQVGLANPGMVTFDQVAARPRSAARRTEIERRKADLEAKRRQLIETRMRPQSAAGQSTGRAALTPRMSEL
jgi:hypothetical protein